MIELCTKEKCTGCGACYNICPKKAITMLPDGEGFLFPKIDIGLCVECQLCRKVCPEINPLEKYAKVENPLAAVAKDKNIRVKSSSGGMFSLLSSEILLRGGVVYGVVFDSNYDIYHIGISNSTELDKLRGSKYAQSNTKETYKEVKEYLKAKRWVLYTGTPCQIAGLYGYLGSIDKSLLFTVDLVCHGVPSIKSFKIYLQKLAEDLNINIADIKEFCFRELEGWGVTPSFQFAERGRRLLTARENMYMRLFLTSRLHRKSCYQCLYATPERVSDITIADFWGIGKEKPFNYETSEGCSLVLLNTEKGRELFGHIETNMHVEKRSWAEALKYNMQLHKKSECPKDRELAIYYLYHYDYKTTYNHFFNTPYIRLRRQVGNILRFLHLR